MISDRPRQLALDLAPERSYAEIDYIVSAANKALLEAVRETANTAPLLLVGPKASGKTHLAHIFASLRGGAVLDAAAPETWPQEAGVLAFDGLENLAFEHEDAFFHRYNREIVEGRPVLLTSATAPELRAWGRPDILSRLRAARRLEIGPPDEALVLALLMKGLADHQLVADTLAVQFAARRVARAHQAIADVVNLLERMSAERGRRITRALAAEALTYLDAGLDLPPETSPS